MLKTMEGLGLMLHFLITIFIIGGYIYTVAIGTPDETMKTAVIAIIAYWFGVLNQSKIGKAGAKKDDSTI